MITLSVKFNGSHVESLIGRNTGLGTAVNSVLRGQEFSGITTSAGEPLTYHAMDIYLFDDRTVPLRTTRLAV